MYATSEFYLFLTYSISQFIIPDEDLALVGLGTATSCQPAFGRDEDPLISLAKLLNEAELQN